MKTIHLFTFCCMLFMLGACAKEKTADTTSANPVHLQVQQLSKTLTEWEKKDNLESFLAYYDEHAISMPEYQPAMRGKEEISAFYKEILQKQKVHTFERNTEEIIQLGNTVVEIGTFRKEYADADTDSLLTQNGKYWHVWEVASNGNIKLKGEAFGYFHPVEHPQALTVPLPAAQLINNRADAQPDVSFELKAYNALMEKGVRNRDGILRSEFFTDDALFMPFADSTKRGIAQLKPYMIAYNSGKVTIDSISVYTYDCQYMDEYVLEYPKFFVKWRTPQDSGTMEGKGIRIWKRQKNNALKIYREIGTHNL